MVNINDKFKPYCEFYFWIEDFIRDYGGNEYILDISEDEAYSKLYDIAEKTVKSISNQFKYLELSTDMSMDGAFIITANIPRYMTVPEIYTAGYPYDYGTDVDDYIDRHDNITIGEVIGLCMAAENGIREWINGHDWNYLKEVVYDNTDPTSYKYREPYADSETIFNDCKKSYLQIESDIISDLTEFEYIWDSLYNEFDEYLYSVSHETDE